MSGPDLTGLAGACAAGLLGLAAFYAVAVGAAAVGLRRVLRAAPPPPLPAEAPFVTVIVPARDEAAVIERCLASVLANDYPPERFEVLVVDDLSRDATAALVRRAMLRANARLRPASLGVPAGAPDADEHADGHLEEAEAAPRLRLLQMPENLGRERAHKKRAIEKGVAEARGTLVLTTDADCVVPARWIRTMAAAFGDAGGPGRGAPVAFVSGPVLYTIERAGLLRMQALEFLGLVAFGAGTIGLGRPTTCNGANVAYRRDVFEALGGFSGIDHLTSGDDELLMQKVARETPYRVAFCAAAAAAVETAPVPTLGGFLQQRRRWASKGVHYPSRGLVATLVAVWAFHAALVAAALAAPFVPGLWAAVAAAFALDVAAEAALVLPAARHFGRARLLVWLLPAELLRVPYFAAIGVAGAVGRYEWKGRRVVR